MAVAVTAYSGSCCAALCVAIVSKISMRPPSSVAGPARPSRISHDQFIVALRGLQPCAPGCNDLVTGPSAALMCPRATCYIVPGAQTRACRAGLARNAGHASSRAASACTVKVCRPIQVKGPTSMGKVINGDHFSSDDDPPRISTGNPGIDDILSGGLDANRMYLCEGHPGTGKTTLGMQFLLEGVKNGENVLYIALSESTRELRLVAKRHGWKLDGIEIFEMVSEDILDPEHELTVLHPAEMELSETTRLILDKVESANPTRVVLDSLS